LRKTTASTVPSSVVSGSPATVLGYPATMLRTVALVGIFACSHDAGGIAAGDYAAQAAAALCDYEVRCGLFADQMSCLAFDQTRLGGAFQQLLDSGKAIFDGAAAQACLDAIANMPCDQTQMAVRVEPSACLHEVDGSVGTGGACKQSGECQSGACAVGNCGSACCAGTCEAAQAPAGSGEPCVTRPCDVGLACSRTTGTWVPLGGSGAGCTLDTDCDYGLGCPAGRCKPLPAIGQMCPQGVCADIGATCNAAMTCVMVGLPGAPCQIDQDCSPFATCDVAMGKCAALPTLGEPCQTQCSDGSYCNIVDGGSGAGTCTAPGSDGAPCTRDNQCASDYCSDIGCAPAPVCI
jgi:hypothetical protein